MLGGRRGALLGSACAAILLIGIALVATGIVGSSERGSAADSAGVARLSSGDIDSRKAWWGESLRTWGQHPLVGKGGEGFSLRSEARPGAPAAHRPHGVAFAMAVDLGALGLILLSSLLVAIARGAWIVGPGDAAGLAARAAAVTFALHALVDWVWTFPLLLACALALVGASLRVTMPRGGDVDAAGDDARLRPKSEGIAPSERTSNEKAARHLQPPAPTTRASLAGAVGLAVLAAVLGLAAGAPALSMQLTESARRHLAAGAADDAAQAAHWAQIIGARADAGVIRVRALHADGRQTEAVDAFRSIESRLRADPALRTIADDLAQLVLPSRPATAAPPHGDAASTEPVG
jgi:hypothetical protein